MPGDFKPQDHIEQIQGKDYLNAQWRLAWFRDVEPEGQITTQVIEHVPGEYALVKAIVSRAGGGVGTGHKLVTAKQFPRDYLGKAETQAIARALGAAGFGTQFAIEFGDEDVDAPEAGRVADSGVSRSQTGQPMPRAANAPHSAPQAPQRPSNVTALPQPSTETRTTVLEWLNKNNVAPDAVLSALGTESMGDWLKANPGVGWAGLKKVVEDAVFPAPAEASS